MFILSRNHKFTTKAIKIKQCVQNANVDLYKFFNLYLFPFVSEFKYLINTY